jgi:DNA-binding MarR family transcriptional regulator
MLPEAFDTLWALSALRVAVEHGTFATLAAGPRPMADVAREASLEPTLAGRIVDVLVAHGLLARARDEVSLTEKGRALAARGDALRADLAVTFGQTRALVEEARRGTLRSGWNPQDPEIIRAQAALAHGVTLQMARPMAEVWPDLARALEREGATYLDVGVGAAGGACAMCKLYPKLRVVGIDPLPAALVEARATVAAHGLGERIELRAQRGDELADKHAFDVAFLPAKFFDDASLEGTLRALSTALRPEGLLLTSAWRDVGDARTATVSMLRDQVCGAGPRPTEVVTSMLQRAGFREVRVGPASGSMVPILARR